MSASKIATRLGLAGEGLLPLGKRGGLFLDWKIAGVVWAEHGQRMLAKRLAVPPGGGYLGGHLVRKIGTVDPAFGPGRPTPPKRPPQKRLVL